MVLIILVLQCLEKSALLSFAIDLNDGCVTVFVQRFGQSSLIRKKSCLCSDHNQQKRFTKGLLTSSLSVSTKNYKILNSVFKAAILFYQVTFSYFLGGNCRHYPSCSNYAIEAFEKHNFTTAFFLMIKRILGCHPLSGKHSFDPVPAPFNLQISKEVLP